MNPLFDHRLFIPDGEAHVMRDGRLYVYGSMDVENRQDYCSTDYHVLSTDDPRLERWTDHGVSFSSRTDPFLRDERNSPVLYAPDALEKDGKYYLYYCTSDGGEAVAVSEKPSGPFVTLAEIDLGEYGGIDPAVFRDDDGSVYYYWGQFYLCGAKLRDDMTSIDWSTFTFPLLTETEHGFHEGSSVRKYRGRYYLLYTDISRGRATCISYAVSDSPLGPFRKGGVIIDNALCDPETWNNHGSMEAFCGQWYVFYHRSSRGSRFSRRLCAEKIFFDENGVIREVPQTSAGGSEAIAPGLRVPAYAACRMMGSCRLVTEGGEEILRSEGGTPNRPNWAEFRPVSFEGVSGISLRVRGKGTVRLCSNDHRLLAVWNVCEDSFTELRAPVSADLQADSIWITFEGNELALLDFVLF